MCNFRKNTNSYHIFQMLTALRYMAKGDFYSEASDLHGISRSSMSRHLFAVVRAINRRLPLTFPGPEALPMVRQGFYEVAGIPRVVGAVDGTLIAIKSPPGEDEAAYVGRKGYHCLNVQAVVDPSLR
jgi:hypothetical protein